MKTTIHQSLTTDSYINYLRNKFKWDHCTYNEIDWQQKHHICKLIPANITPWATKLGTNRLPLNGEKFFPIHTPFYPSCKQHRENTDHFLTCTAYPDMTQPQKKALRKLLDRYNIDPNLRILLFRIAEGQSCDTQALLQPNPQFPL